MKKLIFILIFFFGFVPFVFSETKDSERQQPDFYQKGGGYESNVTKSSAGSVFGITMTATQAAGWIVVYDVASVSDITSSTEPKIEIQTAAQYDTEKKDFESGLKFYNGITLEGDNARGVLYYY